MLNARNESKFYGKENKQSGYVATVDQSTPRRSIIVKSLGRTLRNIAFPTVLAMTGLATASVEGVQAATVKVAFSLNWTFADPKLAKKWFDNIKTEFEKKHPGDTMELIPVPGTYDDFITKLSLLYNSPDTKPDIVQYFDINVGQFAASDLLSPLDDKVADAPWWKDTPAPVQASGKYDGKIYSVAQGINTYGILFDRTLTEKAGLPKDWKPKSWKDILDGARAIKKTSPDASPLYVITGTAQGTFGVVAGPGLLLSASSNPTIYDQETKKWVVDSKGIREVLNFYRTAASEGLLAPTSQIMDPNGATHPAEALHDHKFGITFAGNWIPVFWSKEICAPCWDDKEKTIGFSEIPTAEGQQPGIGASFNGVVLSMSKDPSDPKLAWSAMEIMQARENLLNIAAWVPVVPATASLKTDKSYLSLTQEPFQKSFAELSSSSRSMPSQAEFPIWGNAFQQATQAMVLKPETTIDEGVNILRSYMATQVGEENLETLP
ncbi:ABC transporter substrate-binding protein [Rhizobium leguminosarum]|uniref:ABC transporter substrate-binding protein n=1 Tax=Rhizobium leguminosarum TaxID=384 RepID=UPI00098F98AE|nr:extracellular solute-binding protein [Rhizobium leguminosarum]ASS58079.1 ABC transporter substrate-binding protein [Rhizobium leguminosarum bv. viciae]MBY5488409.1 extracellular solute-binding protein [Rhizobium leguminosarum]MDX6006495.1 extracellular solute-binding protein [Rhizobium leguminosarum]NKK15609.1 extracellular solute-binding protein [Rhizobium leguminosarum bv. viciae]NKK31020.1 extracellular solute-binding protein [Rhizobium leguminosarum bv. viciae]